MATLSDLFDQIIPSAGCVGHPEFQVMVLWDYIHSVYVVYRMPPSCSWCYPTTEEEVVQMVTPAWASAPGWLAVGMRVELPAPGEVALCASCGWLFSKRNGYYKPGEYAYCADCCHW
jgi:hypothetical protein